MNNDMGKVVPFRRKNENNNINVNNYSGDINSSSITQRIDSQGNDLNNVQNDYKKMTIEQANWLQWIKDTVRIIGNTMYAKDPTGELVDIITIDYQNNIIYQNNNVLNMYPWGVLTIQVLMYMYGEANSLLNAFNYNKQFYLSNQLNALKTQTEANKLKLDADKYITVLSSDCSLESVDKIYENKVDSLGVIDKK